MKKIKFLFLSALIAFISCERDDICAESTSTTPRLSVEFYDATEQDELKSVTRLTVYGDSPGIPIPDDTDNSSAILVEPLEPERVYNNNSNAVKLPLLIGNENETITTRFVFEKDTNLRLNDNVDDNSNIDIIEISYTNEFQYVSRACGYKSVFSIIDINLNPDNNDDDLWISNIEISETLVDDENTVHVRILH
jgi:hypothetical protein